MDTKNLRTKTLSKIEIGLPSTETELPEIWQALLNVLQVLLLLKGETQQSVVSLS